MRLAGDDRDRVLCSPEALASRFTPADLPEQFVLGEHLSPPDTWETARIGPWSLNRHPTLPCIALGKGTGEQHGWLLGYPVSPHGTLLRDGSRWEVRGDVPLEDQLYELGGRWLAISARGLAPRVYLDPTGSLSAVYAPEMRLVASTPTLVPYRDGHSDRGELIAAMGLPWTRAKFPVGMTPRHGVYRLLPNHYLDLSTFQARRHWPDGPWVQDPDVSGAVHAISDLIRRNASAALAATPCAMPLTAGRDSRTLLASARGLVDDVLFYTIRFPDSQGDLDTRIAQKIAEAVGLHHRVVPLLPPREADLDEWLARTGCGVGEIRGWQASTTLKSLDPTRATLMANIGETARGRLWRPTDTPDTVVTAERMLAYCKVPPTEETLEYCRRWLQNLPIRDPLQILTLIYIEQQWGCWGGIVSYAEYAGPGFVLQPMNHRHIVERMIRLPVPFQRERGLAGAVIEDRWPQLLRWPFNEEYGIRKVGKAIRQRIRRVLTSASRHPPSPGE